MGFSLLSGAGMTTRPKWVDSHVPRLGSPQTNNPLKADKTRCKHFSEWNTISINQEK